MRKASQDAGAKASQQITKYISGHADWRRSTLAKLRKVIQEAAPELEEGWKWGVPVWSHQGLVCSIGAFRDHVKLNFFQGASLKDPRRLFNAGLEAKTMRAVDLHEGDKVDAPGLTSLVRAAVAHNAASRKTK
jgi:hypothetical protein